MVDSAEENKNIYKYSTFLAGFASSGVINKVGSIRILLDRTRPTPR
jgi:hypothetical protein